MNPDIAISMELQEVARELSNRLRDIAGQDMGFSLLVFQAQDGSRMNYVSNCNREEVKDALTSLLEGWKQGMPDIKAHEVM